MGSVLLYSLFIKKSHGYSCHLHLSVQTASLHVKAL